MDGSIPLNLRRKVIELQLRRNDPNGTRRNTTGSLAKDIAFGLKAKWLEIDSRSGLPIMKTKRRGRKSSGNGLNLRPQLRPNPNFYEWLMGFPRHWTETKISNRKNRIKALGNAVVPQVSEIIGRMIFDAKRRINKRCNHGRLRTDSP
jgi:site-specific DNA-cytosine methylase